MAQFVVLAYGIAGLFQLDQDFRHSPVLLNSIVEAVRLLFLLPPGTIEPATVHGALFIESVRLLSLTTTTVFLFLLLVPVLKGAPASRGRAVEIVQHWGTTSLAHFLLWDDKSWVTAPDGLVAYRVTGKVALALGGPIGSAEGRAASLLRFVDLCDANGWTPGFHQVTEADRQLLEAEDFQLLHIGANAIVEVKTFSIEGSHWKSLRSTARRLERGGHHVEELLQPLSDETLSELRAISDAWLSSDGHSERSFTLGQFGDDYLRSTKVLAVRNSDGDIQAFVNLLPPYLSGTGSFDLMRRHPESANGVMDLLMLEMIDMYREAGLEGLDLGLAPLAQLPAEDLVDRGLAQIKTHGDQFFHFVGLEQYKAKWLPRWEPSYLAYRTKFDLPAVLLATKTAGEIKTKSPLVDRLSRVTKMYPASLVLCGLITWLMVATALDPSLHVQTFGLLALSWNDIRELEWWRLVTSPLVQTEAGIVPGNLIMTLTLVPLAERLFRSRKSMLAFWVGDFGAVVPVLLVLRLSAAFGSATAFEIVNRPDAGSSAGLWSLAGLIMTRLPERRVRLAVVTIGAGVHLVLWVTQHRLFDLQHLIALIVGYGLGIWWAGRDEPESSADRR